VAAERTQEARRPALEILILGGKPIREPVFAYGPFVMNSKSELIEAVEDFEAGKFGTIPPDALMPHRPLGG
jgi:redox-sensitive bicupin YhaK (pirin superfamily)